jgi:hypothetical protein
MNYVKLPFAVALGLGIGILSTLYFTQYTNIKGSEICTAYASETFGEDVKVFGESVERYSRMHGKLVKTDMDSQGIYKEPTQICSLPFDTLKKFLHFMELYSIKSKIKTEDLEVPIYYAVHDTSDYQGALHTVYIGAALKQDGSTDITSFDPRATYHKGEVDTLAQSITRAFSGTATTAFLLAAPKREYLKNQWHLCPTNCPFGYKKLLQTIQQETASKVINYKR